MPAKKQRVAHSQKPSMQDNVALASHHVTTPKPNVFPPITLAAPRHVAKVDPRLLTVSSPSVVIAAPHPVPKVSPQPVIKVAHQPFALAAPQADPMVENKRVAYPLDNYITNEELANLTR